MAKESKFEKKKKEMARKMKGSKSENRFEPKMKGKKSPSGSRFEPEMDGGEHDKEEKGEAKRMNTRGGEKDGGSKGKGGDKNIDNFKKHSNNVTYKKI